MNAIIALSTFCEVHGPKVIFTTQTYRDLNSQDTGKLKFYGPKQILNQIKDLYAETQQDCEGCCSIGHLKYLSNEHETRTSYLSAEQSLSQEINSLLKHACIRSLSCEIHHGKEGVCYFGDETRGHVLSHTFALKDAEARGLRRWCSFIVFMRDKQFLLNMWPFLVDNLQELIHELQYFTEKKYNAEEAECPQRVVRLATVNCKQGSQSNTNKQPRSLIKITFEKHVFIRIHMWFVWILSAGVRNFIEILPMKLLNEGIHLNLEDHLETDEGFTLVNAKSPVNFDIVPQIPEFTEISHTNPMSILRKLRQFLGQDEFRQILYAALIGIQVLVRGPAQKALESVYGLCSLVPRACQRVKIQAQEYMDSSLCNFISVDTSIAVPLPCAEVCRLDILPAEHVTKRSRSHIIRWMGNLQSKLPTLQIQLEKSIENEKLTDTVVNLHFSSLQQEWMNIAKVIHTMHGHSRRGDLTNLMINLGVGPQDEKLLEAWSMGLPSNPA